MNTKRQETISVSKNKNFQHDLSHRHTTTMDFFRLQPVICQEVIPGGKYSLDLRAIVQAAPLATQVFGGMHLDLHAFFVPNRIIWENWNEYYAGSSYSGTSSITSPPSIAMATFKQYVNPDTEASESYSDTLKERRRVFGSLGYPTSISAENQFNFPLSSLQARAYQKIWWDYYRDSVNIPEANKSLYLEKGNSTNPTLTFETRYRTFKKDYVTTLLANPQLGSSSTVNSTVALSYSSELTNVFTNPLNYASGTFDTFTLGDVNSNKFTGSSYNLLSTISVPALRAATAMQRYLERLNVTGTRPMERLMALLGVRPSAERLDMAEFLGGKTIKINVDGLVNTGSAESISSSTVAGQQNAWGITSDEGYVYHGQGYQTGYAVGSGNTDKINYTATEHGFIMVIASIIPEYSNPNTMQRQFIRGLATPDADRFDFFHEDFDGLGYQECILSEVAVPQLADENNPYSAQWVSSANPFNVVGYQPKYEEYRFTPNRISGDFQEPESFKALRNLVFTMNYSELMLPSDVTAGLDLTTSNFSHRSLFDKHFSVSSDKLDHFIVSMYIVNDASLPISGNELPTELSDLANSESLDVSNGGVRL